jgi:hypothetical protein
MKTVAHNHLRSFGKSLYEQVNSCVAFEDRGDKREFFAQWTLQHITVKRPQSYLRPTKVLQDRYVLT